MWQESKLKARLAGSKQGKPPAGRVVRPHFPVPPGFSPRGCKGRSPLHKKTKISPFPPGRGSGGLGQQSKLKARLAGSKQGKPPAGRVVRPHFPVPPGFSPRGCKGRSPLHKKTKNLPLPRRGRGLGGWGLKRKLKAGRAGDKEGKPPRRGRQGQVEPSARRQMRKLSKQPRQQHLELQLL